MTGTSSRGALGDRLPAFYPVQSELSGIFGVRFERDICLLRKREWAEKELEGKCLGIDKSFNLAMYDGLI